MARTKAIFAIQCWNHFARHGMTDQNAPQTARYFTETFWMLLFVHRDFGLNIHHLPPVERADPFFRFFFGIEASLVVDGDAVI
jgi:hypothetical protein